MCPLIENREIVVAVPRELTHDQTDGFRERADDGIPRGRIQAVQARAGGEDQRLKKGMLRIVEQDCHLA